MVTAAILTMAIAGTALAAYGTYQEGKSAEQQAKAQAAWHAYNARVAKKEKAAEEAATAFEAKQQRRGAKQLLARQRALIGASGVTMEGSPLLVAEDTAAQLAIENINIRKRGTRRAATWESRSILETTKAGAARTAGSQYAKAGLIGAGTSILTGAAQTGYMGYKMKLWGT